MNNRIVRVVTTELIEMESDQDGVVLSVDGDAWVRCIHCKECLPESVAWHTPGDDSEAMCAPCAVSYVLECQREVAAMADGP